MKDTFLEERIKSFCDKVHISKVNGYSEFRQKLFTHFYDQPITNGVINIMIRAHDEWLLELKRNEEIIEFTVVSANLGRIVFGELSFDGYVYVLK